MLLQLQNDLITFILYYNKQINLTCNCAVNIFNIHQYKLKLNYFLQNINNYKIKKKILRHNFFLLVFKVSILIKFIKLLFYYLRFENVIQGSLFFSFKKKKSTIKPNSFFMII
jgi:hypothetical protein